MVHGFRNKIFFVLLLAFMLVFYIEPSYAVTCGSPGACTVGGENPAECGSSDACTSVYCDMGLDGRCCARDQARGVH
mgnify:CR=1 FL=1